MIFLYKEINGKVAFVDYGINRLESEYKRQGYYTQLPGSRKHMVIEGKVESNLIHHIHRARFNLRRRINNLICKLIPERFLSY